MTLPSRPIVVVGSINMDLVAGAAQIPAAGQTLIGSSFTTTPGGKGANQAVAAARLGARVHMVGMVGDDVFSSSLIDNLAQANVRTEAVGRAHSPSGVAMIAVAASGENSIIAVPGANGAVHSAFVDRHEALIASAGMVLCQLELPLATVAHAVELCARLGIPVMLDPAPAAALPDAIWPQLAWFTPNETEAALYVGGNLPAETTAQQLLARGLSGVALKRGAQGVYVAERGGKAAWVPAFHVEAIDTVAAGDCFNGAFAVALLEGFDPWAAARFASAASAISVTRHGAQASMPSRAEVDRFLTQHA